MCSRVGINARDRKAFSGFRIWALNFGRVVEAVFLRLCLITARQPASAAPPRLSSRESRLVREYSAIRSRALYSAAMLLDVPLQFFFAVNEKPVRHC